MIRSPIGLIALLALCVGGPYVLSRIDFDSLAVSSSDADSVNTIDDFEDLAQFDGLDQDLDGALAEDASFVSLEDPAAEPSAAAGMPVKDFAEVLRFDVTPDWVVNRWDRVTTTLADTNLEGFRVILVTGTALDDLTGTLTFYFNHNHHVQRLTFIGQTGDARRLVQFLEKRYAFHRRPTLGAGLYMATWNGAATSVMQVRNLPVITKENRHRRLQVKLEINRPDLEYRLSDEFRALLQQEHEAGRW